MRYASIHGVYGHDQSRPLVLPINQLVGVVWEAVLPSVERPIEELKAKMKVVRGVYLVGQRVIVSIMETDFEEELYEILEDLPISEVAQAGVTPLKSFVKSFEELRVD